jgi:hypothetical protein
MFRPFPVCLRALLLLAAVGGCRGAPRAPSGAPINAIKDFEEFGAKLPTLSAEAMAAVISAAHTHQDGRKGSRTQIPPRRL